MSFHFTSARANTRINHCYLWMTVFWAKLYVRLAKSRVYTSPGFRVQMKCFQGIKLSLRVTSPLMIIFRRPQKIRVWSFRILHMYAPHSRRWVLSVANIPLITSTTTEIFMSFNSQGKSDNYVVSWLCRVGWYLDRISGLIKPDTRFLSWQSTTQRIGALIEREWTCSCLIWARRKSCPCRKIRSYGMFVDKL